MQFSVWILATVLSAAILKMCSSQSLLQWQVKFNGSDTATIHFNTKLFAEFYGCLFEERRTLCGVSKDNSDSWALTGLIYAYEPLPNITRYVCSQKVTDFSVTCTKVTSEDDEICINTKNCRKYTVDDTLLNFIGKLPFVEILPAPNVSITPTIFGAGSSIRIDPCAQGCSFETQPPPNSNESTTVSVPYSTGNINSSTSSSSSSSSSSLTTELGIIIGLAVGLVVLIVVLITLGVFVWRRRQKPRDNIMSNDVTANTFTTHDNGIVNNGRDYASADDVIHPYSTSKASTSPEMGTKDTKGQYETIDLDPDPELGIPTRSSIKSNNGSSIQSAESKKRALPSVLENPYSEPETKNVTGSYSTVDFDDAVDKFTIASDQPQDENSLKLDESPSQVTPSASENPHAQPDNKTVTDPYTRINPNSKSQKKKNTADSPNMEEAEHDTPDLQSKVTDGAESNDSVSVTQDGLTMAEDESGVGNVLPDVDSENAYSKLHETQRHFQNPYSVLSDPFTDTPDQPSVKPQSSNVDIIPETSTPAFDLPAPNDVVTDGGDKTVEADDLKSEPNQSESDSDKNAVENKNPDVSMHASDYEEIKVKSDKDSVEYSANASDDTSATRVTGTGTAKENEELDLESDAESSTDEEKGD